MRGGRGGGCYYLVGDVCRETLLECQPQALVVLHQLLQLLRGNGLGLVAGDRGGRGGLGRRTRNDHEYSTHGSTAATSASPCVSPLWPSRPLLSALLHARKDIAPTN